jgi:NAD(P)-dependent dehydrogenase (short-subunit alcohol dehydrogenase family)
MGCLSLIKKFFPDKFSLKDKVAVVTGGAGLLGKPISMGLAQADAKVYVADNNEKEGIKLEKQNKKLKWIKLDITDIKSINSNIKKIIEKDKKIDIWVNCAYPRTTDWSEKFEEIKYESWKKNVDMHLNGYFLCCQQIAKEMKKQKSGTIINFSSIYGVVGPDFSIYEKTKSTMPAAYSAIKGGIITFTRYLATYYAKYGVRANVVCPGGIFNDQPKNFVKKYEEKTPMKRMGKPEDVVGPVIFLACDAASYITGHVLMVDGGWTAW